MYCKNCGTQLENDVQICPSCGTVTVSEEVTPPISDTSQIEYDIPFSGKAIAGFVLSLVGIIVAGLPCGILGIVFTALAMKDIEKYEYRGMGLAISGLVISIIDVALMLLWLL